MKILIISLSNLGDAILTSPAIEEVRQKYPQAAMHVLASPNTAELFSGDPRFSRVLVWEKSASLVGQLRRVLQLIGQRYSLVVDFKNTLIPIFLIGAKRTPLRRKPNASVHRIEQHLSLLDSIGIPRPAQLPLLPFGAEESAAVEKWLSSTGNGGSSRIVVIVPGAKSHLKRWSPKKFAEVADRLAAEQRMKILLVGGPEDKPEADAVRRAMQQPALDLAGQTSLRQLAALLSNAELVITNDTANLHAAQAMRVPTLAIFGPTDEKKYGPRHPNSAVVRKNLVCSPCEKALCAYNHECMEWITADEVYSSALKLLNTLPVRPELVEGRKAGEK